MFKKERITNEEVINLITLYQNTREVHYRNRIIEYNMKLVYSIAKRYKGMGIPLEDLVQDGVIGMITAIEKFNTSYEVQFSTYAVQWIRQSMLRSIADKGKLVRLPVHVQEESFRLRKTRAKLMIELGREPSIDELVLETGESREKIERLWAAIVDPLYLDNSIGDDENSTMYDIVRDTSVESPDEVVLTSLGNKEVIDGFLSLIKNDRDKEIIIMRYGLDGNPPMTLDEVGSKFLLTRERIRQIETRVLDKIRLNNNFKDIAEVYGVDKDTITSVIANAMSRNRKRKAA